MDSPQDGQVLEILREIRNWVRVASYPQTRAMLEQALPDAKSRAAYQMFDGTVPFDEVRIACKMSPNAVVALTNRCVAMGLMQANSAKKRVRLFDLRDFGLLTESKPKAKEE